MRTWHAALTCICFLLTQIQHNDADVLAQLACVGELPTALATLQAAGRQVTPFLRGQGTVLTGAHEALDYLLFRAGLLRGTLRPASLPLHNQKLCKRNNRAGGSHVRRQSRAVTRLLCLSMVMFCVLLKMKSLRWFPKLPTANIFNANATASTTNGN